MVRRGADEETEISREDIREAIGNLRVEKAAGRDEVRRGIEVWKGGGGGVGMGVGERHGKQG